MKRTDLLIYLVETDFELRSRERRSKQDPADRGAREAYIRSVERAHGAHAAASVRHEGIIRDYAKTVEDLHAHERRYGKRRGGHLGVSYPTQTAAFDALQATQRAHRAARESLIATVGGGEEGPRHFTARTINRDFFPEGPAGDMAHHDTLADLHGHTSTGKHAYKGVATKKPRTYTRMAGGSTTDDLHQALLHHGVDKTHKVAPISWHSLVVTRRQPPG